MPQFKDRTLVTDPQKVFHWTDLQRLKPTRANDPYEYQAGWNNRHSSEVIPGTLPSGQNNPQENRFGLYTEGITYSAFAAPRRDNYSTYMYRARPAAAHGGYLPVNSKSNIENCFLSINPKVATLPEQAEWHPFPLPKDDEKIDFADGLHTLAGSGDPNIREGIAIYVYLINASMEQRAFCNTDGDFLICAQQGNLDIKTEMGMIFLQPGEICVIQRGIRFSLNLAPDTKAARGYITEVWGSMWELPDLGPLGGHGLANPRDFLYPVAAIDDDLHVPYHIINKTNGQLITIQQNHSPYDLVAWHGNVVPYKYDLTKFSSQNSTSIDHTDPSIFCVLTAKSRDPVTPLADFLWFGPRWDVATNTFRLPYFHRNSASEFLACIYGQGLGRSDEFLPGGGSFEGCHTPHGGFHEGYQQGMRIHEGQPEKILTDQLTIMIESSRLFLFTEYARVGCGTISTQGTDYKVWDALPDKFSANATAKKLLARVKADKIAEKKRLAPYYFGGFSHGANTSETEGVHSEELAPYLNGTAEPNGQTNGVSKEEHPIAPIPEVTNGITPEAATEVSKETVEAAPPAPEVSEETVEVATPAPEVSEQTVEVATPTPEVTNGTTTESTNGAVQNLVQEVSNAAPVEAAKSAIDEVTQAVSDVTIQATPEEATKAIPEDITKVLPESITKPTTEEAPKASTEGANGS